MIFIRATADENFVGLLYEKSQNIINRYKRTYSLIGDGKCANGNAGAMLT